MKLRYFQTGVALVLMTTILALLGADLTGPYAWAVWSILALTVVLEHLAWISGIERGIEMYLSLSPEQQRQITAIIQDSEE
jgi:prepilin signal peptidase PulO-like enzyme (type II secretory pathway)